MLFQALMNIPQAINDGIQQSVAMATGDYYTGQVEENQDNKELGVFFSNMATSDPSYMEGDLSAYG
jgi:hypothetical protein